MGEKVYSEIINRLKLAKYFAISVDSTPDIAHTDQMTVIMHYISPEGMIQERFVTFLSITSHTGESIFNSVIAALNEMDIDVQNCRGQCYDNASSMAGLYEGVQARIREINPLAEWVPCAAHSLNLVGVNTVDCCLWFFTFVQNPFKFFSKSTWCWQILTAGLQCNDRGRIETLKSLSETRWSAHAQAVHALCI